MMYMTIEDMERKIIESNFFDLKKALDDFCVTEHDQFGNNILHYYLKHAKSLALDFKEIFNLVLDKGLDINDKQSKGQFKRTCLQMCVVLNLREIFDFLVEKGASVNSIDANGNSILISAVLNYSKDPENYGHYIKVLLMHGANPFIENKYEKSAYALAENIRNSDVKKYFEK